MSPDRKNLLEVMWREWCRRCPCGRCDCLATDPVATARRVFRHWAAQHQEMAESLEKSADGLQAIVDKFRKKRRKLGDPDLSEDDRRHSAMIERRRRDAGRSRRAAELFGRLARGEAPFGGAAT